MLPGPSFPFPNPKQGGPRPPAQVRGKAGHLRGCEDAPVSQTFQHPRSKDSAPSGQCQGMCCEPQPSVRHPTSTLNLTGRRHWRARPAVSVSHRAQDAAGEPLRAGLGVGMRFWGVVSTHAVGKEFGEDQRPLVPSRELTPSTDQSLSQPQDSHHKACRQLQKPWPPTGREERPPGRADFRFLIPDHLPPPLPKNP